MNELATIVNIETGLHIFVEPYNGSDIKEPVPLFSLSTAYREGDRFMYEGVIYQVTGQKVVSKDKESCGRNTGDANRRGI